MRHESVIGASLSRIVEVEPWVNDRALLRDTQLVMDRHPLSLFSKKVIGPSVAVSKLVSTAAPRIRLKGPTAGHHLLGKDYIPRSTLMHYSVQLYCMCLTPKWIWTKIFF